IRLKYRFANREPLLAKLVCIVHLEYSVFLHDAQQQQYTKRAPQIQSPAREPQRKQREWNRQRQRQHNRERMEEALELRSQHHVHEDRREQKRNYQVRCCFFQNLDRSKKPEAIVRRHSDLLDLVAYDTRGLIERKVRRVVRIHRHLKLPVESLDSRWPKSVLDRRQVVETHLPNLTRRNHQPRQHLAITLLFGQQLKSDVVLLVTLLVG